MRNLQALQINWVSGILSFYNNQLLQRRNTFLLKTILKKGAPQSLLKKKFPADSPMPLLIN